MDYYYSFFNDDLVFIFKQSFNRFLTMIIIKIKINVMQNNKNP